MIRFWSGKRAGPWMEPDDLVQCLSGGWKVLMRASDVPLGCLGSPEQADKDGMKSLLPVTRVEERQEQLVEGDTP